MLGAHTREYLLLTKMEGTNDGIGFWEKVRRRKAWFASLPKSKRKEIHNRSYRPGAGALLDIEAGVFAPTPGLNAPIAPMLEKKVLKPQEKNKRKRLMERQDGKCAYCLQPFSASRIATIDHVLPKSKGGGNKISNIVLACSPCNQLKGDLSTYEEAKRRSDIYLAFAERLKEMGYIQ